MTAEQVLSIARGELGNTEVPAGSNRTKYGKWYGMNGQPWCMMFVQWCFAQAGAAELLLEQAEALEERGDFWPEYADIIAAWNEGTVLFDQEGMLVVFSHYVLGPYAMGTVELRLDYGQLAELVGAGGMARLGIG